MIVTFSYGVLPDRLADATKEGLLEALQYANRFPRAVVAFATCTHCFTGSEYVELGEKKKIIHEQSFPWSRVVVGAPVQNTVTELRAIKTALTKRGVEPKEILLVVEAFHSRSARYITEKIFPGVEISLVYSNTTGCQPDHPFSIQRHQWKYILVNVLRQIALRILGIEWMSTIVHSQSH